MWTCIFLLLINLLLLFAPTITFCNNIQNHENPGQNQNIQKNLKLDNCTDLTRHLAFSCSQWKLSTGLHVDNNEENCCRYKKWFSCHHQLLTELFTTLLTSSNERNSGDVYLASKNSEHGFECARIISQKNDIFKTNIKHYCKVAFECLKTTSSSKSRFEHYSLVLFILFLLNIFLFNFFIF